MFFKSIELMGFKSFPDKITLNFEKGITSVVGPNGSGKSNISDAIRWVMGEQSIKTLRGGKMEDVIFSGTAKRKPLGFCEVSLLVDNKDRGLNIDYDEVLVTRRLFRSGESEYYINKSTCRLKDVQELFMDTGLGKDGYSLVGQGKIDSIISGKPSERRVFFEEACGISKYHHKKDESERKLENTRDNIVRINDIVAELETQLMPLKTQSEKAKKFLVLRDELKTYEVNLWLTNYKEFNKNLETIGETYENSKKTLEDTKEELSNLEQREEELSKILKDLQEDTDRLTQENYNFEYNIKTFENQIEISNNDIVHINSDIKRLNNEKKQIENKIKELNNNKDIFEKNIENIEKEKAELVKRAEEEKEKLDEILNGISKHNQGLDKLRLELSEKNNKFLSIKAKKSAVLSLGESLNERITNARNFISEKEDKKKGINLAIEDLTKELDSLIKREESENNKFKVTSEKLDKVSEAQEKYLEKLNILGNKKDKAKNRLSMLLDMESSFSGSPKGVRDLMTNIPKGATLFGTVSSLIKTENKYALAIDSALGATANHIVCDNEEDAKKSISYLKENKLGRVTFMPLKSVKPQNDLNISLNSEKGYIGIAKDLLTYDKKYENIVSNLLNKVAVFSDFDSAKNAEKKYKNSFKAVTLTGEIFSVGGSITGGEYKNNLGALKRSAEADELKKELEVLERDYKETEKLLNKEEEELLSLRNEIRIINESEKEINESKITILSRLKYEKDMLSNINKDVKDREEEIKELNEKTKKGDLSVKEYNEEIAKCQKDIEKTENEIKSEDRGFSDVLLKKDEINEVINDLKLKIAEKEKDISYEKDKQVAITGEEENLNNELLSKKEETEELEERILDINDEIEFRKTQIADTKESLNEYNINIGKNKDEKEKSEKEISEVKEKSKDLRERFIKENEENSRLSVKVSKIEGDIEAIVNNLWESYELTITTAEELKKDIGPITSATRKISELKGKIKELGNINIDAIEEYKTVNERYEFLTTQRDDLLKAKEELEKIISEMIVIMKQIFKEQFALIAKSFDETYRELFGGGMGTLRLTDPANILESGIEIEVQPPGKKLTTISLLSGGEKAFTAIALLFAIIKVKPTPFCMFDEIEAALDDNNVYRYAEYLTRFKKDTQFIVITHRRGTMEAADTLYGVTMQEKGVSKLLSLNIDEIEKEGLSK